MPKERFCLGAAGRSAAVLPAGFPARAEGAAEGSAALAAHLEVFDAVVRRALA